METDYGDFSAFSENQLLAFDTLPVFKAFSDVIFQVHRSTKFFFFFFGWSIPNSTSFFSSLPKMKKAVRHLEGDFNLNQYHYMKAVEQIFM